MKTAYNALLIGSLLLALVEIALAHPVDSKGTNPHDETLQYPYAALGLDDPEVFEMRRQFWHHKRELEAKIDRYHQCYGKVQLLLEQYGWHPNSLDGWFQHQTLNYSAVVPGHPCVNAAHGGIPGVSQLDHCRNHRDAAIYTSNQMDDLLAACDAAVGYLRLVFGL